MEKKVKEKKTYEETYTMREIGGGISVSVPKIVVKRKAREKNMSVEEFKNTHKVRAMFDDFQDVDLAYTFVKKEEVKNHD